MAFTSASELLVAVIVAFPVATAVIFPVSSTVATLSSLEDHVTVVSVALSGVTAALTVTELPT